MNSGEIATKSDIEAVLNELRLLRQEFSNAPSEKDCLRSADVRRLLNVSDSTLQRMRISGAIKAKKIGGTWFYKYSDINKLIG